MSNENSANKNGISESNSEQKKECVKEFLVSDKFKPMIEEVFISVKKVLAQRKQNLTDWTSIDEEEFIRIFGINKDVEIQSKYSARNETEKRIEKVKAREFMLSGINRFIEICNNISVENRTCVNGENLYGNFLNYTHITPGSARIESTQTLGCTPKGDDEEIEKYYGNTKVMVRRKSYKDKLRIEIFHNFLNKPLWGHDSKVSTLCHELSHLCRYGVDNESYGGMGTLDLPTVDFDPDFNYEKFAAELVGNPEVFKNSYNIERYFEIKVK